MNGEEESRHLARTQRNIARVVYKPLHRGKLEYSSTMSNIQEEPQLDAVKVDICSLDGASGGLGDVRNFLYSKPRFGEWDVSRWSQPRNDTLRERADVNKRRTSPYRGY